MGHHSLGIHPVATARRIPIAQAGRTVHCRVTNQQTPVGEARALHADPANQVYCFACGRSADDFRCLK